MKIVDFILHMKVGNCISLIAIIKYYRLCGLNNRKFLRILEAKAHFNLMFMSGVQWGPIS